MRKVYLGIAHVMALFTMLFVFMALFTSVATDISITEATKLLVAEDMPIFWALWTVISAVIVGVQGSDPTDKEYIHTTDGDEVMKS